MSIKYRSIEITTGIPPIYSKKVEYTTKNSKKGLAAASIIGHLYISANHIDLKEQYQKLLPD